MAKFILNLLHRFGIFWIAKAVYWRLLGLASRNGIFSDVWYLFSGAFRREHRTILSGRVRYKLDLENRRDNGALYKLRRNTHRLEKGIIMRPRRDVFALAYIHETVSLYKSLTANLDASSSAAETLSWAYNVLMAYFECVDTKNDRIAAAQQLFLSIEHWRFDSEVPQRPYKRKLDEPVGVTVDDLHQLAYRRRSCRWFLQQKVPRELIDKSIEIGAFAPSACNRQPFRFKILDRPEDAKRIGGIPGGTAGFFENFPCVMIVIGDLSAFPSERDRHVPYIDASLAVMGIQFALEVQGLSSCCINWPDIEAREQKMEAAIELSSSERVIMLVAIGYPDPDGMVPYSQKKPLSELRSYFAN